MAIFTCSLSPSLVQRCTSSYLRQCSALRGDSLVSAFCIFWTNVLITNNILWAWNYLVLGFHQSIYRVTSCFSVDHFLPYLWTKSLWTVESIHSFKKKKKKIKISHATVEKSQCCWSVYELMGSWELKQSIFQTCTLMSFSSSASRKSSVTGSANSKVYAED